MGAAAQQRGDASIRRGLHQEMEEKRIRDDMVRILQITEDCNVFVRAAMGYLVEPRGLRQNTVERAKTRRGWVKRHEAVMEAHNAWVDSDNRNVYAYGQDSIKRAKAVHALLVFALGCWTIPDHINVPRTAIG